MVWRRLVSRVERRQRFARANRLACLANQAAVHDHCAADSKIGCGKFMFCCNIGGERVSLILEKDLLALAQVLQRDEHVVLGIELEYGVLHFEPAAGCAVSKKQDNLKVDSLGI